jgi:hypothetical protein
MFIGICPHCDYQCIGLELLDPQHLECPNCGIGRLVAKHNYQPDLDYLSFWMSILDSDIGNKPSARDCGHRSSAGTIVFWGEWRM